MLAKRIIPCLDVKNGQVVKGVRFRNHQVVGEIAACARFYADDGADELVFYDITASAERRTVDLGWVEAVARMIDIPFCVAGGIRSVHDARRVLAAGADKVSINSPALERPSLINELAAEFGRQCVVVGLDSMRLLDGELCLWQYTGDEKTARRHERNTLAWVIEVQERGAGEIVLNCMNADGTKAGYDVQQLAAVRDLCRVPLVASGGAGTEDDFERVFREARVDAALAASVFHRRDLRIPDLKNYLQKQAIEVRV